MVRHGQALLQALLHQVYRGEIVQRSVNSVPSARLVLLGELVLEGFRGHLENTSTFRAMSPPTVQATAR